MDKILEVAKLLGFELAVFIAGLAGALVSSSKLKLSAWERVTAVLSGGFIANYLTPFFGNVLNFSENTNYGIGFLIGYIGMRSVEYAIDYIHEKFGAKKQD